MPPDDTLPAPMSPVEALEFKRRRRGRNMVLLGILIGLAALFYAISIVKFKVS